LTAYTELTFPDPANLRAGDHPPTTALIDGGLKLNAGSVAFGISPKPAVRHHSPWKAPQWLIRRRLPHLRCLGVTWIEPPGREADRWCMEIRVPPHTTLQ
jgi:hypothetical protein